MGAIYFTFCVLTAVTGALWEVNPFDQPGVEEAKVYIRKSLSVEPPPAEKESNAYHRLRGTRAQT